MERVLDPAAWPLTENHTYRQTHRPLARGETGLLKPTAAQGHPSGEWHAEGVRCPLILYLSHQVHPSQVGGGSGLQTLCLSNALDHVLGPAPPHQGVCPWKPPQVPWGSLYQVCLP